MHESRRNVRVWRVCRGGAGVTLVVRFRELAVAVPRYKPAATGARPAHAQYAMDRSEQPELDRRSRCQNKNKALKIADTIHLVPVRSAAWLSQGRSESADPVQSSSGRGQHAGEFLHLVKADQES